jgi:predicted acetyltransferase
MAPVNDYTYRPLEPSEHRASINLFRGTLQAPDVKDEDWPRAERAFEPGRSLGAFHGDTLAGTARSFAGRMAVPGGAVLPMAMVTMVGVRADHTRRGVLTGLMRAQLAGVSEPFATLRASEGPIYRRFGYGVATRGRDLAVDRRRAVPHPGAPSAGRVRIVPLADAVPLLTEVFDRIGPDRPGWAHRPPFWWESNLAFARDLKGPAVAAVHSGPDGDDGFAVYYVDRGSHTDPHSRSVLWLSDLVSDGGAAWSDLWRFVLSVDLVDEVRAHLRPVDEPVEWLFTDRRAVSTSQVEDEVWLRLVDVPTALAAREFGDGVDRSDSVVVEVHDGLLPANAGRYRIGDGTARRTDETAELVLDVAELAALYLGDVTPSELAMTGRLTAVKSDAPRVADRLFAVPVAPWCGTYF